MDLSILARLKSWRTSTVGAIGSATVVYLFTALGCRWPEWHEWATMILPALVGIITKEKGVK